eukprot:TRINITY_DN27111_c0_g2_i1.p1 TRINITY_DN27111_c0_g2~~TRINITY_DN27111_c0_g2_i1.p1  ORF type:complete len:618 (-),score=120.74 TRINITY_DN27111_c0_g2_i1:13-1866(-)
MKRATRKGEVLQWVFSGLHDVAPVSLRDWRRNLPKDILTKEQQLDLRRVQKHTKRESRAEGRALAASSPRPKPAPEPRRLQAATLDLLPPPQAMDAAGLGRAASVAARSPEGTGAALWSALGERAMELLPALDPQDLTRLLGGLARARSTDERLLDSLFQCVKTRRAYFSSRHLAMTVASLTKLGYETEILSPVLEELEDRVPELLFASELSITVAALGRLQNINRGFVNAVAKQVELRLGAGNFHVRELSTVSVGYARLSYAEPLHLRGILACARHTLHAASPSEIGNLVGVAVRIGPSDADTNDFVRLAAEHASEKARFLLPDEFTLLCYSFGQAAAEGLGGEATLTLLESVVGEAVTSSKSLGQRRLANMLHSCARWQLPVRVSDLEAIAEATCELCEASSTDTADIAVVCQALRALSSLWPHVGSGKVGLPVGDSSSPRASGELVALHGAVDCRERELEVARESSAVLRAAASRLDANLRSRLSQGVGNGDGISKASVLCNVIEARFIHQLSETNGNPSDGDHCVAFGSAVGESDEEASRLSESPSLLLELTPRLQALEPTEAGSLRSRLLALGGDASDPLLRALETRSFGAAESAQSEDDVAARGSRSHEDS